MEIIKIMWIEIQLHNFLTCMLKRKKNWNPSKNEYDVYFKK
jgi:hypothetical protein